MNDTNSNVSKKEPCEFSIKPWKVDLVSTFFEARNQGQVVKNPNLPNELVCKESPKNLNLKFEVATISPGEMGSSQHLATPPESVPSNMLSTIEASVVQRLTNEADSVSADFFLRQTTVSQVNKNVPGAVSKPSPNPVSTPTPLPFIQLSMASNSQSVNVSSSNYSADPCGKPSSEKQDSCSDVSDNLIKCLNSVQCLVSDELGSNKNKREVCEVAKSAVVKANAHNLQDLECLDYTDKVSSVSRDSLTSEMVDKTVACANFPILSSAAIDTSNVADAQNNLETPSRNILAVHHGDSTTTGTVSSPICSSRPAMSKKSSPQRSVSLMKRSPVQMSQDRGSTCVSIILKSSRLTSKPDRMSMVSKKLKEVEELVSSYNPKFCHRSSPGVQVRLDYCFHQSEHARKFFKAVHSLADSQSHSFPKMVTCILYSEEELGYQYEPVLTENDLLCIQSPEYCRNIFRTAVVMRVKMKENTVVYEFRNVTDVNRFLYNKSSSVKTRCLGLLRKNVVPKMMEMDNKGFYRLYSAGPKVPDSMGNKHRFKVDGPFLLFSRKLDLFAFLVSEDAVGIDHLQFDDKYIIDVGKSSNSETGSKVIKADLSKVCDNSAKAPGVNDSGEVGGEVDRESAIRNVNMRMKQCKDSTIEQVAKGNYVDFERIELSEHDNPQTSSKEASKFWKVCEVKASEEFTSNKIEVPWMGGILGLESKTSRNSEKEVKIASNVEANVISSTTKELKIASDEKSKYMSALLQKDEQIKILKRKLLIKEKMLQAEIMEKNATNISHKQALSQLEEINKLSSLKCDK